MRRVGLHGLVAAALLASACGGDSNPPAGPGPTPVTQAPTSFTLSGVVRDEGGQPVSGAVVAIVDGRDISKAATTDDSGGYALAGLASGAFTVSVRRDGYSESLRAVTLTANSAVDITLARARIALAGNWNGTFNFVIRATKQRGSTPITASVTQTGNVVSGTFVLPGNDWTGSFTVTLSSLETPATIGGTLAVSGLISTDSGRCNGRRSNSTGTASVTGLTLLAGGQWEWDECISTHEDYSITLRR